MKRTMMIIIVMAAFAAMAQEERRALPMELSPLSGELTDRSVWDFSAGGAVGGTSLSGVMLVGDSLLAESDGERRDWFFLRGDTVFYAGWERLDEIAGPERPLAVFARNRPAGSTLSGSYAATGRASHSYSLAEEGTFRTVATKPGRLITAPGDTLRGITMTAMTVEAEVRPGWLPEGCDTVPTMTRTVYRWYAEDDVMPVAIQTSETYRDGSGKVVHEAARACAVDVAEYLAEHPGATDAEDTEALKEALRGSMATFDGRDIQLDIPLPDDFDGMLTVDIVDASGHIYSHSSYPCSGPATVKISADGLRRGDYIAAISLDRLPGEQEKRIVSVR